MKMLFICRNVVPQEVAEPVEAPRARIVPWSKRAPEHQELGPPAKVPQPIPEEEQKSSANPFHGQKNPHCSKQAEIPDAEFFETHGEMFRLFRQEMRRGLVFANVPLI